MSSLNKSFSSPVKQNPEQGCLYDQLENIYNSDAYQNKRGSKLQKQLYFKLIQQNQKKQQDKKSLEKQVNRYENQQIDLFWKNRENQLRERQKRQRQMIQQARDVNNSSYTQKVLSKSMVVPCDYETYHKEYYADLMKYETKLNRDKQFKNQYFQQAQAYNEYKNYQENMQRQKMTEAERKKLRQNDEIQQKRLQQLQKWRKKYLQAHNKEAFQIWDKARRSRMSQQDALENYIVFQGARELNERTSKMKNQIFQRQNNKRQEYIRQLHSQLQDNEYRTANGSKNQKQTDKRVIQQRNQFLSEKDRLKKQIQDQQHKKHLQVLKSQIKPRVLLPQKQKVQFPGLGSPVHIGKAMADDRRKQLQWLEKNLYRQLKY